MGSPDIRQFAAAGEVNDLEGRMIQAVLFDLGETLLHFGQLEIGKIFDRATRLSYEYLKSRNQPAGSFAVYRLRNFFGIRLHLLFSYLTGNDFDSLSILKKYGKKKGFSLSEAEWEELNWQWYQPLTEKAQTEPDIVQTLQRLRQMGLRLGILSNTFVHSSSLDRHLSRLGLLEFFPVRLYSYQFPFRKPDQRIFFEAARQLQTEPRRIVFVGDRIEKDVRGAQRAGMAAVLKHAYTNQKKRVPDGVFRIQYLSELPELIETLNRSQRERSDGSQSVPEMHQSPVPSPIRPEGDSV
ncbi:MAG: HAD family hydrolase [Phycisphaerae bacterium]|jgi:HAD superfamily hydrolase (TIGR01549 family)|nr:HAD family hydrolase [Phycisphaerae bacterium]